MRALHIGKRMLLAGALVASLAGWSSARAAETDLTRDASPWGIASGAEWSGEYPRFDPMLSEAGVTWLRLFPEWQTLEPRKGEFNWKPSDAMLADAKKNNINLLGVLCYFAPWATTDRSTRTAPIKNIQDWADYTTALVKRYNSDIKHWEIYNEFNGSFSKSDNKPRDYAAMVEASYDAAKAVDPQAMIGISCANFDLGFFDAVIKAGAAGHFDFVCVHPYENVGMAMEGGEDGYLSLVGSVRKMLSENRQKTDMPIWITETGWQSSVKPDAKSDAAQADALAKVYILSMAQGFDKVFWFEARGPAYGHGTDHGIIRPDWSVRPAYDALRTMTTLLGAEPKYRGWLDISGGGFGFVFEGKGGKVLAAWAPVSGEKSVKFDAPVKVTDLAGKERSLPAGEPLTLTRVPVLVTGLPAGLVTEAEANRTKKFPWGGDYASATKVSCRLGATNVDKGIKQTNQNTTSVVNLLDQSYRRSNVSKGGEGFYVYFRVDPQFVPFGTKELEITLVAKRIDDKPASMSLTYESMKGYRGTAERWAIPAGDEWQEHTWKVNDANFVGGWGWNFRTDAGGGANDFLIKEVRVKKPAK